MNWITTIERTYEMRTACLEQETFSTEKQFHECLICHELTHEDDNGWHHPHPCAEKMRNDWAWVCCEACAVCWKDEFVSEIEHFEKMMAVSQ